jgi:hypothetical protein
MEIMHMENSLIEKIEKVLPTDKETISVLLALFEGLSSNVLSGDVWWLSIHQAKHISIEQFGISEEVFEEVMKRFNEVRVANGRRNPMSSMF